MNVQMVSNPRAVSVAVGRSEGWTSFTNGWPTAWHQKMVYRDSFVSIQL